MINKKIKVKIKDIVDAFERCDDSYEQLLSLKTGEIVLVFNDMFGVGYDESEEERKKIENDFNGYIQLPNKYELYEYNIMQEFANVQNDIKISKKLFLALNKKRPFRHFKDAINYLDVAKEYYKFYKEKLYEKAKKWCRDYNIDYVDIDEDE